MRTLFLSAILLLCITCVFAQSDQDSLWRIWQDTDAADTTRVRALLGYIPVEILESDPDSALVLANAAYRIAEESGSTQQAARALLLRGRAHNQKGAYDLAYADITAGIAVLDEVNSDRQLAESYLYLANLWLDRVEYDSASAVLDLSMSIYRDVKDSAGIATVLLRKAYAAQNQAEYAEAMEYALEALRIRERLRDEAGSANASIDIANLLYYQEKYKESIEYSENARVILADIGDQAGVADAYLMTGESYLILEEYDKALEYIDIALDIKETINSAPLSIGSIVNSRGNVYKYREEYENALADYRRALDICRELNFDIGIMATTANVGHVYILMGRYEQARPYILRSIEMMEASENRMNIVENYFHAATIYEGLGQYDKALEWYQKYSTTKDSIFSLEKDQTLSELRTQYETEKKEEQILALEKEAELKELARQRDRQIKILLLALAVLLVLLAFGLLNRLSYVRRSRAVIQKERDRSEHLLLNILPAEVAEELKEKGHADAHLIEDVTVIFTDFKGFTALSEQLTPEELVSDLNECFSAFDRIMENYGIEKIKTIGDAYMAAGGLPTPNDTHARDVIKAALEIRDFIREGKAKKVEAGLPYFEIRIGVHTGPVVAGIVGVKKFQYDIWGDTVNTASRMESSGDVGQVNISETTYELVRDRMEFKFTGRGKVEAKGKGEIEMYFVESAS